MAMSEETEEQDLEDLGKQIVGKRTLRTIKGVMATLNTCTEATTVPTYRRAHWIDLSLLSLLFDNGMTCIVQ